MHSVRLELIPKGPAIAICTRSTSCTAGVSWRRASMQNVRVLSRACMCLISVAASGGASRYLAAERGCRVAAIDLTPNFVEVARVLAARCGLADRIEVRQANALALPFQDGTFDHVWSYAVTMNIADKEGLAREVSRVLKSGGRFSCNEIARGQGEDPVFPLPWATDETSSFLASPAVMRAALETSGLSILDQVDLTPTRLGDTARNALSEPDDHPLRLRNLQSGLADGRLVAEFILAEKSG